MAVASTLSALLFLSGVSLAGASEYDDVLAERGRYACLSREEAGLLALVNRYRAEIGLNATQNSRSLNKVARIHLLDLLKNNPVKANSDGSFCNPHSWSDKGFWKSLCYTADHRNAAGMWSKPREITGYAFKGNGYELFYMTSENIVNPARALESWKEKSSHNDILAGKSAWQGITLQSVGVGIINGYASAWFSEMKDPLGPLPPCARNEPNGSRDSGNRKKRP